MEDKSIGLLESAISTPLNSAVDSLFRFHIFFRNNNFSLIQALIVFALPMLAGYMVTEFSKFGLSSKLDVDAGNLPLIVLVFFLSFVFVLFDPHLKLKRSREALSLAFSSTTLFSIALILNLLYSSTVSIFFGPKGDIWVKAIHSGIGSAGLVSTLQFAVIYGFPFMAAAILLTFYNSERRTPWRMKILVRHWFFWRAAVAVIALASYQYLVFILVGTALKLSP